MRYGSTHCATRASIELIVPNAWPLPIDRSCKPLENLKYFGVAHANSLAGILGLVLKKTDPLAMRAFQFGLMRLDGAPLYFPCIGDIHVEVSAEVGRRMVPIASKEKLPPYMTSAVDGSLPHGLVIMMDVLRP